MTPIFVGRDKTRRAIEDTMTKDGRLFIATQKRASEDDPDCASLYAVGVTADIIHRMALPDGTMKVRVCCSERAAIVRSVNRDYLAAEVAPIQETRAVDGEAFALMREIFNAYQAYTNAAPPQSLYRYARNRKNAENTRNVRCGRAARKHSGMDEGRPVQLRRRSSAPTACCYLDPRSLLSLAQYSNRFLISRSKPRSGGS
jgi:ATP-dependent Lon protease